MTTNKTSFSDLINGDKPVLVDFSAEWCGPCKMMAPILKELSANMGERIRIVKIDVDRNPAVAGKYQIQGVPTLILFEKGNIKWRESGIRTAAALQSILESHLVES